MQQHTHTYLRFVRFKDLNQWDVKRFWDDINVLFSSSVKLKDILSPYYEPVSKEEMLNKQWHIISKINFSGKLFLRDVSDAKTFKGNLNKINSNTLIYSKINVRHGCIYFHPNDSIPFGVSSEYPAYKMNTQKVNGEFLVMIIRSDYFKNVLNQKTSGISKARVKPEEFLNIKIPLPALERQQALVKAYKDKIKQAETLEKQAENVEQNIEDYMLTELGIKQNIYSLTESLVSVASEPQVNKQQNIDLSATYKLSEEIKKEYKYLKFVRFKDVTEWGYNILQTNRNRISSIYYTKKVKDICSLGSGGTPSRSIHKYYQGNIPWIKTGEVVNDSIFDTEEHITQEAIDNSSAKLYPKGSLIIAMYGQGDTRGRTAKMEIDATTNQACAVLYNIDNNVVTTDYLWYYFQCRYNDLRSLASGNNQPNLNAEKIKNYDVVIPPIEIQNAIVENINKQKSQIKKFKLQAGNLRKEALEEFEKEIFE